MRLGENDSLGCLLACEEAGHICICLLKGYTPQRCACLLFDFCLVRIRTCTSTFLGPSSRQQVTRRYTHAVQDADLIRMIHALATL